MPRDTIHVMHDRTVYALPLERFKSFCAKGKRVTPVSVVFDSWSSTNFAKAIQQEGV